MIDTKNNLNDTVAALAAGAALADPKRGKLYPDKPWPLPPNIAGKGRER